MPADYKAYNRNKKSHRRKGGNKFRWLWLGLALLIFLIIIGWYSLKQFGKVKISLKEVITQAKPLPSKTNKLINSKPVQPAVKFEFYNLLPNEKVVVPENANKIIPPKIPKATSHTQYILQVASLRSSTDADVMSAKLAMQSFPTRVKKINIQNNTWYRVQIGPFNSLDDARDAQNKLRKLNNDAIIKKMSS